VGMIFQDPDDQLFMPTVREDVAFGPYHLGLRGAELERRVEETLAGLGITHLTDRPPHKLSAGEKRRAAFATVLSMTPDILVLDEPSTGLDPRGRRQIISLLKSFTHTRIVATHDLDLVHEVCPRTVVLHEGRLRADGPTPAIFADASLLEECGLEQPPSVRNCPVCGRSKAAPGP
ncbi:MAG TPA: energy-coupling factor ABC transporter ATP-binding protein, partial [Deltaproteobacteria bacterium]|nr:energy-coupling factor ABC transporter ATP-binding protein [Deltaproteobacteria bacterium]